MKPFESHGDTPDVIYKIFFEIINKNEYIYKKQEIKKKKYEYS